jgi:hypothetical protein
MHEKTFSMSLQVKLNIFKAQFEAGAPPYNVKPEVVASMHRATEELKQAGLAELALKVGERAPSFAMPDEMGTTVSSQELLTRGPIVLTFFRGAW